MATVAGVGCAELYRQIRPRHAETVVVPGINNHVVASLHMAGRAGKRRFHIVMMAMGGCLEFIGGMTLHADTVPRRTKCGAVRLVAIAAGDALCEHRALLEGLIVIGFLDVADLAIGKKEPALERRHPMRVGQPPARHPILRECAASRMTEAA